MTNQPTLMQHIARQITPEKSDTFLAISRAIDSLGKDDIVKVHTANSVYAVMWHTDTEGNDRLVVGKADGATLGKATRWRWFKGFEPGFPGVSFTDRWENTSPVESWTVRRRKDRPLDEV